MSKGNKLRCMFALFSALRALEDTPGTYVDGEMTIAVHDGSAMSNCIVERYGTLSTFAVDGVCAVNDGPN